jgi:hypothetical protein
MTYRGQKLLSNSHQYRRRPGSGHPQSDEYARFVVSNTYVCCYRVRISPLTAGDIREILFFFFYPDGRATIFLRNYKHNISEDIITILYIPRRGNSDLTLNLLLPSTSCCPRISALEQNVL